MEISRRKQTNHKTITQTSIFSLSSHESVNSEGKSGTFYKLHVPDWINVLAITEDKNVVLVKQYRHGTDEVTLEIPGGAVDREDSDHQTAAERELLEETGFQSNKWTHLGTVSVNPAIMNNYCHLYLAENCVEVAEQNLDQMEEIEVQKVSLSDFFEMIEREEIDHSLIISAVGRYLLRNSNK